MQVMVNEAVRTAVNGRGVEKYRVRGGQFYHGGRNHSHSTGKN